MSQNKLIIGISRKPNCILMTILNNFVILHTNFSAFPACICTDVCLCVITSCSRDRDNSR